MKIAVAGIGYVGLSNAILLAQHNEVTAVDVFQEKVDFMNKKTSEIYTDKIGLSVLELKKLKYADKKKQEMKESVWK